MEGEGVKAQGRRRGKGRYRGGETGKGEKRNEEGRGKMEDEGGEKEDLPPLEWRSGYAPALIALYCYCYF